MKTDDQIYDLIRKEFPMQDSLWVDSLLEGFVSIYETVYRDGMADATRKVSPEAEEFNNKTRRPING